MKEVYGKQVCETLSEVLNPEKCAILVIDLQNDAMRPNGALARAGRNVAAMIDVLPLCADFINEARRLRIRIIHVRTVTLSNGRSMAPSWIRFASHMIGNLDGLECFMEGTWGAEICDEVAPQSGEIIVTKRRSSAFVGTDLHQLLRANGVETVVVIGEQTPGCVEATYRDAAYRDYYNVLIEDCVAAFDPELHEASLKIQRARHDVCTSREALDIWRQVPQARRGI